MTNEINDKARDLVFKRVLSAVQDELYIKLEDSTQYIITKLVTLDQKALNGLYEKCGATKDLLLDYLISCAKDLSFHKEGVFLFTKIIKRNLQRELTDIEKSVVRCAIPHSICEYKNVLASEIKYTKLAENAKNN